MLQLVSGNNSNILNIILDTIEKILDELERFKVEIGAKKRMKINKKNTDFLDNEIREK